MKLPYCLLLALTVLTTACTGGSSQSERPSVTVSIEPQRWLLEQIAGDRVRVNSLLDKNADPESFDPSMAALQRVESGMAYFTLGNNAFEQSIARRLQGEGSKVKIVDTGVGIDFIHGTHTHGDGHDHHEHTESDIDPHIWTSVANMRVMAANMERALEQLDPAGADFYRNRLERLDSCLDSLDRELRTSLTTAAGTSFMVWHPSLSYFARDYGLEQLPLGLEGKEVTPAAMMQVLDKASHSHASVMILQAGDNPSQSAFTARQAGADTATVNLLDYNWPATMRRLGTLLHR